jgi:hypothetical protein
VAKQSDDTEAGQSVSTVADQSSSKVMGHSRSTVIGQSSSTVADKILYQFSTVQCSELNDYILYAVD